MVFTSYPAERLQIPSIYSRLTDPERRLRMKLMEQILRSTGPVNEADISQLDMQPETGTIIQSLINKRVIVKDSVGDITFVYPVSALPTSHKVRLQDGRTFHAMCAIDALGAAFTFEQDVSITSVCGYCQEPITAVIHNEHFAEIEPPSLCVLHVDLKKEDKWATSC